jgi:hypothetical protein
MLRPHLHRPEALASVQRALEAPSLYDEALRLMARRGIAVPADRLERDWTQPYVASSAVEAAWLEVYRAPETHWELYQLGEELVDFEDLFRQWRFRHVTTVERTSVCRAEPEAPRASATFARCSTWCCSPSCGRCAARYSRHAAPTRRQRYAAARSTARVNTASSIGSVSLPVNVFCWLGWNEHSSVTPTGATTSTRCPNLGRGRTANSAQPAT